MYICSLIIAVFLCVGLRFLCDALVLGETSLSGRRTLSKLTVRRKTNLWEMTPVKQLTTLAARVVYIDRDVETKLRRQLDRAGLPLTPREFTARKYTILGLGAVALGLFALLRFYIGLVLGALLVVYALLKQRDSLTASLKAKDTEITGELPRFVRTICRNLRSSRDLRGVIQSYRKVAGPALGGELDILLADMGAGNISAALNHFQARLGSEDAYRLCGALQEIERGVDQVSALDYMADDMARKAKAQVQKTLSARPGQMRRTYYPAIGVCVAMIMYVLIEFIKDNLNNLF